MSAFVPIASATNNDPIVFILFEASYRIFEFFYCLLVIITFWKGLKKQPSTQSTSQISTKEGTSNDAQNLSFQIRSESFGSK
jgi:hypothetical protein